ncbi:AAA family ATPase [Nocardia sp. NPDC050406]|uniref:AAA family ATPase n=1 Tax=Nocardia sp. NPDC050406 TaxID=3364318 RepID=UPI0037B18322
MTLIGREGPARTLRDHLHRTLASHGGLLLIAGEAGIGKTALITEVLDDFPADKALVLAATAWSGDGVPGYWPWVQILRRLRTSCDAGEWAAAVDSAGAALVALADGVVGAGLTAETQGERPTDAAVASGPAAARAVVAAGSAAAAGAGGGAAAGAGGGAAAGAGGGAAAGAGGGAAAGAGSGVAAGAGSAAAVETGGAAAAGADSAAAAGNAAVQRAEVVAAQSNWTLFDIGDAVTAALVAVARRRPVFVVIDDLHRADPESVRVLTFIARHAWFERIALVAAVRDTELEAENHPLRAVFPELWAAAHIVELGGLSVEETGALAAGLTGNPPPPAVVRRMATLSGGNPFLAEQTVRLWRGGGSIETLGPGVRQTLEARLAPLPDRTVDALHTAAIIGREFAAPLVAAALGTTPAELSDSLIPAVRARLISPLGRESNALAFGLDDPRASAGAGGPQPGGGDLFSDEVSGLRGGSTIGGGGGGSDVGMHGDSASAHGDSAGAHDEVAGVRSDSADVHGKVAGVHGGIAGAHGGLAGTLGDSGEVPGARAGGPTAGEGFGAAGIFGARSSGGRVGGGDRGDRFVFVHDLIRETLLARATGVEVRRRHGAVLAAMEGLSRDVSGATPGDFAHHAYQLARSGDAEADGRALRYLLAAAEDACGRSAAGEVAQHYRRALTLVAAEDVSERGRIGLALAAAAHSAGQLSAAREAYRTVLRESRETEPGLFARAALGLHDLGMPDPEREAEQEIDLIDEAHRRLTAERGERDPLAVRVLAAAARVRVHTGWSRRSTNNITTVETESARGYSGPGRPAAADTAAENSSARGYSGSGRTAEADTSTETVNTRGYSGPGHSAEADPAVEAGSARAYSESGRPTEADSSAETVSARGYSAPGDAAEAVPAVEAGSARGYSESGRPMEADSSAETVSARGYSGPGFPAEVATPAETISAGAHSGASRRPAEMNAEAMSGRALRLARESGDPHTVGASLLARHDAIWKPGTAAERLALAEELHTVAECVGDEDLRVQGYVLRIAALLELGDPRVHTEQAAFTAYADRTRLPRPRFAALSRAGSLATLTGHFDAAARAIDGAYTLGERTGEVDRLPLWLEQRWALALTADADAEVETLLDRYRRSPSAYAVVPLLTGAARRAAMLAHPGVAQPEPPSNQQGSTDRARRPTSRTETGPAAPLLGSAGPAPTQAEKLSRRTEPESNVPMPSRDRAVAPAEAYVGGLPDQPLRGGEGRASGSARIGWPSRAFDADLDLVRRLTSEVWAVLETYPRHFHAGALVALARAALVLDDPALRKSVREMLFPLREWWAVIAGGGAVYGPYAYWLGRLAVLDGERDTAAEELEAAAAAARRLRATPWTAAAEAELARLDAPRTRSAVLRAHTAIEPAPNVFRLDGDVWTLVFADHTAHMPALKGLRDLHTLIANPGQDISSMELLSGPGTPETTTAARSLGADAVLDERAKAEFRRRLEHLDAEIDRATARSDDNRAAELDTERAALLDELRRAAGLGGRTRRLGDDAERARKTVSARVRDALRRLDHTHPELAEHLRATVSLGVVCRYEPQREIRWAH